MSIFEIVPIAAPALPIFPAPPVPPALPRPPTAGIKDPRALARHLAGQLKEGKRNQVRKAVADLSAADRPRLDAALVPTLAKGSLKQGIELRRIIRFIAHKPAATPAGPSFTASGGTPQKLKDPKVGNGGSVTVKTGVSVDLGPRGKSNDAYSIAYSGPGAADMLWLQMIWREVIQNFPSHDKKKAQKIRAKMRIENPWNPALPYFLTTHPDAAKDSSKRRWNADNRSTIQHNSPFYEENSPVKRAGTTFTMYGFPSPEPNVPQAKQLFAGATPPDSLTCKFHAETYLVHELDVLYRVKIDLTWTIGTDLKAVAAKPSVNGERKSGLDGPQRACLAIQHPGIDYLPGDQIGTPLLDDEFDPVGDLADAGWASPQDDLVRYQDIAALAHAEFIRDVTGRSAKTINKKDKQEAGLNYLLKLDVLGAKYKGSVGETGFIDAASAYHNPDLPSDPNLALPKVAMTLGGRAFSYYKGPKPILREKAFPLAIMRHEMMHATHANLAIGWLVKWRDDFTELGFKDWLYAEHKAKPQRISDHDFALVSCWLGPPWALSPTEALAYTEGFVTAIPYLPPAPDRGLLADKDTWPAAISELSKAGENYSFLPPGSVQHAVLARIRSAVCGSIPKSKRDSLTDWLNTLLEMMKKSGSTDAAVQNVKAYLGSDTEWLNAVIDEIKKCPK